MAASIITVFSAPPLYVCTRCTIYKILVFPVINQYFLSEKVLKTSCTIDGQTTLHVWRTVMNRFDNRKCCYYYFHQNITYLRVRKYERNGQNASFKTPPGQNEIRLTPHPLWTWTRTSYFLTTIFRLNNYLFPSNTFWFFFQFSPVVVAGGNQDILKY